VSRTIGAASDFYRLRVTRLNEPDEPDLEWRDDILYREPPTQRMGEIESYAIEAVSIDDEQAFEIALYASSDEAHTALAAIAEDLEELTRSEFETRYMA